jgi:hypothetical protein
MRGRFALAAAAIFCLTFDMSSAQAQKQSGPTTYGALYLAGNRVLTRIDLHVGSKKDWRLLAAVGMKEKDLCSARHVPMTCDWYASETILDVANRRLYFTAPTTTPGDDPESDPDGNGRGPFGVLVFDLESMRLLHRFDVGAAPGSMILTNDGKQLLVSWAPPPLTVDTFDTHAFAKISSVRDAGKNTLDTYFTPGSYFLPNGKFIISGGAGADFRIRVSSGHFQQEAVDPRAQLPPKEKEKLSAFVKTQPGGQKVLVCIPVSSRNGKTLVFVANKDMTKTAFWTVDMETGATSAATITDHYAVAQLISSGNEFVTFEGLMSKAPGGHYDFAQTGRMTIYDAATGNVVTQFDKPDLRGAGSVLCLSPDGLLAAYAQGAKISLLNFTAGELKPLAIVAERPEPVSGACGFGE